jgi:hypothetical protein
MSNVIQLFPEPPAPLQGAEREAAIQAYREAAAVIAAHVIGQAFGGVSRLPGCGGLGCEDALPLFVKAFRRELRKSGY